MNEAKADLEREERMENLKRQIAEAEVTREKLRQAMEAASTQNYNANLVSPFQTVSAQEEARREQTAKSEHIKASVQRYKKAHLDLSADPSTQPDIWDRFRIAIQPIKDDVDQREALRAKAQAIRRRHHRRFRLLDRLRDQIRTPEEYEKQHEQQQQHPKPCGGCFRPSRPVESGQTTPWGLLDEPGEDIQPMPRPPPMGRSHNPGYIFRGRTPSIVRARKANAAKMTPANRRLHNRLVKSRNINKHGHEAFYRLLQE